MSELNNKNFMERALDNFLSFLFDTDQKYERRVGILLIVGLITRLFSVLNQGFFADDAIYASQSANIWEAGIISTHSHPALFFYLTDLAYKFFGFTTFASRFFPWIFGSLLIVLGFLIGKHFFDKRTGFYIALVITFTNFLTRMSYTEHTLVTLFFVIAGTYFGLHYLRNNNLKLLILSGILFGLGNLTKYNSVFFVVAFLAFSLYHIKFFKKEKLFSRQNLLYLFIFLAVIFLFSLPFLSFNYLNYKENGIVDFQFAMILKPEKALTIYGNLAGQDSSFFERLLTLNSYASYNLVYKTDLLVFVLSLIGIFFIVKNRKYKVLMFTLLFIFIPFVLQSGGSALSKHFAFLHFILAIPAGYFVAIILNKVKSRDVRFSLVAFLIIFMVINLGGAQGVTANYLDKSGTSELKSYLNKEVGKSDLIVFDDRIYTARSFWLATDNNLLLLSNLPKFYEANQNIPSDKKKLTDVYVVECSIDDCGWGWVNQNQNLNQTSESLIDSLEKFQTSEKIFHTKIYEGNEFKRN